MLTDIHIADVLRGQTFHYAGRSYVMASTDEAMNHPAYDVPGQMLAYHVPTRGDRVPVSFSTQVRVFIARRK